MTSNQETWGARLRARRAELGLTLAQVAARAGCSEAGVSRIENGDRGVSDDLKMRLADALETNAGILFAFEEVA